MSTVICGIVVVLPYTPLVTPVATKLIVAVDLLPVPPDTVICPAVPTAVST